MMLLMSEDPAELTRDTPLRRSRKRSGAHDTLPGYHLVVLYARLGVY